jgi:DNA-binding response OmpR family regulator
MLLTLQGHSCRAASSARAGLEVARTFGPEIAILDIGLPDLSGHELARALRRDFQGRPLYLAALTGWSNAEDRAKSLAAGFDLHLIKPMDSAKLLRILRLAEEQLVAAPART